MSRKFSGKWHRIIDGPPHFQGVYLIAVTDGREEDVTVGHWDGRRWSAVSGGDVTNEVEAFAQMPPYPAMKATAGRGV